MIVYSATRSQFTKDVYSNQIEEKILLALKTEAGISVSPSEINSWKNSMQYMNNALVDGEISGDAGVAIEYIVPTTSKRVDFILTGRDAAGVDTAAIVELKQWSDVSSTTKDAVVETFVGGAVREQIHPSFQAWTYASLIRHFNSAVHEGDIQLKPCAYLHNCLSDEVINSPFYKEHTDKAPAFLRRNAQDLRDFLCQHVRYGDSSKIMYRIENGRLRPSMACSVNVVGGVNSYTRVTFVPFASWPEAAKSWSPSAS